MKQKPVAGEFYRHFKGNIYQVRVLARDSETQKEKVVYQAMYPPFTCWVRDLEEFSGEVDHGRYPDVEQKYRFEKVVFEEGTFVPQKAASSVLNETGTESRIEQPESVCKGNRQVSEGTDSGEQVSDEMLLKALKTGQPERYLQQKMTEEEIARRGFLQLLDAETFREKRQIFIGLKQYLDERMLSNIAVALDIVLEEGDIETQYESIMRCLEAFEHYEGGRLR